MIFPIQYIKPLNSYNIPIEQESAISTIYMYIILISIIIFTAYKLYQNINDIIQEYKNT